MNVDMLKTLYVNSTNNNKSALNKSTASSEDQNSFLSILDDVISGDSLNASNKNILSSVLGTTEEEINQNDDLLTSMMLLMQQGLTIQDNYVDYDNILSSLIGSDSLNVDELNSVIQNIQSTNNLNYQGLESLEGIEGLEGLMLAQQSQNTQTNTEILLAATNKIEESYTTRIFPNEIMESINALRQVRDNINLGISQVAKEGNTKANINTQNLTSTSLESILGGMSANASNNIVDMLQATSNVENSDSSADDVKDIKVDVISEGLLSTNGVNIQNDNTIIKVSDESSVLKESVITQVKDQIVLMKSEGKQTVTMQLTPENLGKLDIKMVFEKGNLSIEIFTSNPKAHSIILSNISELKSVLQNSFADKPFMNVETQKQAFDHNNNQNNQGYNNQHSQQESRDRREAEYEQVYNEGLDDNSIDFFTELSKIREYRYNTLTKI